MIALGYPGEISTDAGTRWLWWSLSMVPFVYTLYLLYVELGAAILREAPEVRGLIKLARNVTVVTWLFYPVAFAAKTVLTLGSNGEVAMQVGYSIADITAKAGYGLVIYMIARTKAQLEDVGGEAVSTENIGLEPARR